jgi:Polysaccharide deacetylase
MSDEWLKPIRAALDGAAEPVSFFIRDDDAGWENDRLSALLDLTERHALPIDLAVIPRQLTPPLAEKLRARAASAPPVGLHQHGLAHLNHEPVGRKCEFGPSRSRPQQLRDIGEGRELLQELLGDALQPIFTPPWNRCTRTTGECLAELGFRALSREADSEPLGVPGLAEVPVRVDWLKRRKGVRLTRDQVGELLARAAREPGPVGIMFHHAVMHDGELSAAGRLLELLAGHPSARVQPLARLLD